MKSGLGRRDVLKAGVVIGGVVVGGTALASCAASDESGTGETGTGETGAGEAGAGEVGTEGIGAAAAVTVSQIPVGGGYISQDPPVVLTQPESGDVKAFTAVCPHAGCLVNEVVANEIICPCHGSRFSAFDGSVISGVAATGLTAAAYQVSGENVTFG